MDFFASIFNMIALQKQDFLTNILKISNCVIITGGPVWASENETMVDYSIISMIKTFFQGNHTMVPPKKQPFPKKGKSLKKAKKSKELTFSEQKTNVIP